jgi:tryptophan synthase alpha chain
VLEIAREIRERSEIPLLLFTYLNPVLRYGLERWRATRKPRHRWLPAHRRLSVEEAHEYVKRHARGGPRHGVSGRAHLHAAAAELVARVFHRLRLPGLAHRRHRRARFAVGAAAPLVRAMRAITDLPLAVGFGISKPEHVAELAARWTPWWWAARSFA